MLFSSNHELGLLGSISWLLFFAFITWNELRAVLRQREVTSETISMSISVYLLMGLTWGLLYSLIYQLQPHAFNFPGTDVLTSGLPTEQKEPVFPVLIYFSLTTLTTIGYGDITPLTMKARYAAIAEGVTGQFYLAILVARLVGMQMSRSMGQQRENPRGVPKPETHLKRTAEPRNASFARSTRIFERGSPRPRPELRKAHGQSEVDAGLGRDRRELSIDRPLPGDEEIERRQTGANYHVSDSKAQRQHRRGMTMQAANPGRLGGSHVPALPKMHRQGRLKLERVLRWAIARGVGEGDRILQNEGRHQPGDALVNGADRRSSLPGRLPGAPRGRGRKHKHRTRTQQESFALDGQGSTARSNSCVSPSSVRVPAPGAWHRHQ